MKKLTLITLISFGFLLRTLTTASAVWVPETSLVSSLTSAVPDRQLDRGLTSADKIKVIAKWIEEDERRLAEVLQNLTQEKLELKNLSETLEKQKPENRGEN